MFERSSHFAVVVSVGLLACGGSTANSPSTSDVSASETPASEPAVVSAAPGTAPAPGASDAASSVSAGTSAAESWLKLVDDGRYDVSWTDAASLFRSAVSSDAWSQAVGGVRGQVGKLVSRKLASANYTTSVPNAPEGKYVIIQYDTSFEKKASAVETVTPMQDSDGTWRVAGYFVK